MCLFKLLQAVSSIQIYLRMSALVSYLPQSIRVVFFYSWQQNVPTLFILIFYMFEHSLLSLYGSCSVFFFPAGVRNVGKSCSVKGNSMWKVVFMCLNEYTIWSLWMAYISASLHMEWGQWVTSWPSLSSPQSIHSPTYATSGLTISTSTPCHSQSPPAPHQSSVSSSPHFWPSPK